MTWLALIRTLRLQAKGDGTTLPSGSLCFSILIINFDPLDLGELL